MTNEHVDKSDEAHLVAVGDVEDDKEEDEKDEHEQLISLADLKEEDDELWEVGW